MRVVRVIEASVWACEFELVETQARITSIARCPVNTPLPLPGEMVFHQIEESRPSGRVLVAIVIGPATVDLLPDWPCSGFLAVSNPAPVMSYGGTSAVSTGARDTHKKQRGREATRRTRERARLRAAGKPEDEIWLAIPKSEPSQSGSGPNGKTRNGESSASPP